MSRPSVNFSSPSSSKSPSSFQDVEFFFSSLITIIFVFCFLRLWCLLCFWFTFFFFYKNISNIGNYSNAGVAWMYVYMGKLYKNVIEEKKLQSQKLFMRRGLFDCRGRGLAAPPLLWCSVVCYRQSWPLTPLCHFLSCPVLSGVSYPVCGQCRLIFPIIPSPSS